MKAMPVLAARTPTGCSLLRAKRTCVYRTQIISTLQFSRDSSLPSSRQHLRSSTLIQAQQQEERLESEAEDKIPPGCARYTVQLSKPLGMVLEENGTGTIYVAELVPGGNADRCGEVSVGDQLIATSGLTYTTQQKYQDNWVPGGEQLVRLNVRGEDFKTVMAAISSHPAHMRVQLEFQRCS